MREDKTEKTKISRLLGRSRANDRKILTKTKLQPHGLIVTSLLHRMFAERIAFFAVTLCLGLSLFWQAVQNIDLRSKLDKKSMYLVPSAISEVIRVRPDMVAPKAVYNFAENIIHKLTNVNFEDADVRYKELSTYMHPELKGRFMREMRPIVEYWKQMKVDQHFSYETPTEFKRTTEIVRGSKKSVFRVEVWGRTKKIHRRPFHNTLQGKNFPGFHHQTVFGRRPLGFQTD